jgi:hypothetical protein
MTLHIGAMLPDRSLAECPLIKAITKVATDLAILRNHHIQKSKPSLDIVFLLPSQQEKADFAGLRLHSFDDTSQMLKIESAVPEKMLTSIHAERFVIAILLDAIDAAGEFFLEKNILFNAAENSALVDLVTAKLPDAVH